MCVYFASGCVHNAVMLRPTTEFGMSENKQKDYYKSFLRVRSRLLWKLRVLDNSKLCDASRDTDYQPITLSESEGTVAGISYTDTTNVISYNNSQTLQTP